MQRTTADAAAQLKNAIEAGDFYGAHALIPEYAKAVQREFAAAASDGERASVLENALQTLNAHLYLARAKRSHMCAHLKAVTGQSVYRGTERESSSWRIEA